MSFATSTRYQYVSFGFFFSFSRRLSSRHRRLFGTVVGAHDRLGIGKRTSVLVVGQFVGNVVGDQRIFQNQTFRERMLDRELPVRRRSEIVTPAPRNNEIISSVRRVERRANLRSTCNVKRQMRRARTIKEINLTTRIYV